jgi:hypothetical protein
MTVLYSTSVSNKSLSENRREFPGPPWKGGDDGDDGDVDDDVDDGDGDCEDVGCGQRIKRWKN